MIRARFLLAASLLVLATGCAVVPRIPPADWNHVKVERQALTHWEMTGRAAVTTAQDGWTAGLVWVQAERLSELRLQGPLGIGGVRVRSDGTSFDIETSKGETIAAPNASAALEQAIGVPLPIGNLRYWLLGVPAPDVPATEELDPDGRLARLEQSGWRATYDRYLDQGHHWLPGRVRLEQGEIRVRVIVDRWQLQEP